MAINIDIKAAKVVSGKIIFQTLSGEEIPADKVSKIGFEGRVFDVSVCKISGNGVVIGSVRIPLF